MRRSRTRARLLPGADDDPITRGSSVFLDITLKHTARPLI
jgi:hypothetical protein